MYNIKGEIFLYGLIEDEGVGVLAAYASDTHFCAAKQKKEKLCCRQGTSTPVTALVFCWEIMLY